MDRDKSGGVTLYDGEVFIVQRAAGHDPTGAIRTLLGDPLETLEPQSVALDGGSSRTALDAVEKAIEAGVLPHGYVELAGDMMRTDRRWTRTSGYYLRRIGWTLLHKYDR